MGKLKEGMVRIALSILFAACVGVGGYFLGLRAGIVIPVPGGLDAQELRIERAFRAILSDLGSAREAITSGQAELASLQRLYGATARRLDDANARLAAYSAASGEGFASREAGLDLLGAIGRELERRGEISP